MAVSENALRWALGDDQRLNIHAFPADSQGAAIGRLIHVGFCVTNGYQDGGVRMARKHADGGETFCFVKPTGKVTPMLTDSVLRDLTVRKGGKWYPVEQRTPLPTVEIVEQFAPQFEGHGGGSGESVWVDIGFTDGNTVTVRVDQHGYYRRNPQVFCKLNDEIGKEVQL